MTAKKIIVLSIPFIVVFGYIGYYYKCLHVSSFERDGRYYNKDAGFSIELPLGWEKVERRTATIAISPTHETVTVVMERFSSSRSFDQQVENEKYLYHIYESGETTINGKVAKRLFGVRKAKGKDIMFLEYFLLQDSKGYSIHCMVLPEKFPAFKKEFEQIVESFRIE